MGLIPRGHFQAQSFQPYIRWNVAARLLMCPKRAGRPQGGGGPAHLILQVSPLNMGRNPPEGNASLDCRPGLRMRGSVVEGEPVGVNCPVEGLLGGEKSGSR